MNTEGLTYKLTKNNPRCLLPDETIHSLEDLGEILKQIHNRIKSEGYVIKDRQIKNLKVSNLNEK